MKYFSLFILIFSLTCSCSKKDTGNNEDLKLYQTAIDQIEQKRFSSAQDNLIELENEYPYSKYAAKAESLNSFISYLNKEYQESHDLADKFIKLRPANEHVEYMYFLRSISILELVKDKYRESETAIKTQRSFRELNSRYPNSIYRDIADDELSILKNVIASHIIEIGRFYQFHQNYLPAILRYLEIIDKFPSSDYVAEAHYRLAECYFTLGLTTEANEQIEKVHKKFKDSKWIKHANVLTNNYAEKIND